MQAILYSFGPIYIGRGANRRQVYDVCCPREGPGKYQPKRLNVRSRGRHDPGSGKYWNRWVMSTQVTGYSPSYHKDYYLAFDEEYASGSSDLHWMDGRATFDGQRCVAVCLESYDGSSGTQPYFRVTSYLYAWQSYSNRYLQGRYRALTRQYPRTDEGLVLARAFYAEIEAYRLHDIQSLYWNNLQYVRQYVGPYWDISVDYVEPRFSSRPEVFEDEIDLGIGAGRTFNHLVADAYVDMVNKLPDMSGMANAVNAIQLVKAGLGVIKALYTGDPTLTLGSLSDAWLGYRYSYSTTKADLEEAASYFSRAFSLLDVESFKCNGYASRSIAKGDQLVARCSMEFGVSALEGLKSTIERYGLQLDAYAAWDLVPFSFVADWFLGIGDRLEFAREANFARRVKGPCWCSIERRWTNEFGFPEIYYYRWMGQPDVSQAQYVSHAVSGATIVKRTLDVLALLA